MLKWGHIVKTSMVSIDGDGCVLTAKNIEHPLIQEFLKERSQTGEALGNCFFKIEGSQYSGGESLHSFLLRHGVNLPLNPAALDKVQASNYSSTPAFKQTLDKSRSDSRADEPILFKGFKKGFLLG